MHKKPAIFFVACAALALLYIIVNNDRILFLVQTHHSWLKEAVQEHSHLSGVLFVAFFIVSSFFTLPITVALTIVGGYFFGPWLGFLYAMIGAVVGTILSFFMIRYVFRDYVINRFDHRLERFNKRFVQHGFRYLLTLQLLPIVPNAVINSLAALSSVPAFTFAATTFLGMLPGTIIFVITGQRFALLAHIRDVFTWDVFVTLSLLALAAFFIPPLVAQLVKYKKRKGTAS